MNLFLLWGENTQWVSWKEWKQQAHLMIPKRDNSRVVAIIVTWVIFRSSVPYFSLARANEKSADNLEEWSTFAETFTDWSSDNGRSGPIRELFLYLLNMKCLAWWSSRCRLLILFLRTQGLSLVGLVDVRHAICYVLIDEGCLSLQSVTLDCVSTERFIGVRL